MKNFKTLLGLIILIISPFQLLSQNQIDINTIKNSYDSGKYENVISITRQLLSNSNDPSLINLLAKSFSKNYQFDSASVRFRQTLSLSQAKSHNKNEAKLGLIEIWLNKNQSNKADSLLKRLSKEINKNTHPEQFGYLAFYKAILGKKTAQYDSLFQLAFNHFDKENPDYLDIYNHYLDKILDENKLKKADSLFNELRMLKNKFNYHLPKITKTLMLEGYFWYNQGNDQKSIEIFERELLPIINNNHDNWSLYAKMDYYRMSSLPYSALKDYEMVINRVKSYLSIAPKFHAPGHFRYADMYESLSIHYAFFGFYELANQYSNRATEIYLKQGDHTKYMSGLQNQMLNYYKTQNLKEVFNIANQILSFKSYNFQTKLMHSNAFFYKAIVYTEREELDKAETAILKSIEILKSIAGDKFIYLATRYNRHLKILGKQKDTTKLVKIYSDIYPSISFPNASNSAGALTYLNSYIKYLQSTNQLDSSLVILNKILPINRESIQYSNTLLINSLIHTQYLKGQYFEKKHHLSGSEEDLNKAVLAYQESIEIIKESRKYHTSANDKISQFKLQEYVFNQAIPASGRLFNLTKNQIVLNNLFKTIELSKSIALLESINRNIALKNTSIPDSIVLKLKNLQQQSSFLKTQLTKIESHHNALDSAQIKSLKETLTENLSQYNNLIVLIEKRYPNFYETNYNQSVISINDVKNSLKENEAMLEYIILNNTIFAFTITPREVFFDNLGEFSPSLIQSFQKIIQPNKFQKNVKGSFQKFAKISHQLFNELVSVPLANINNESINKLYVIPDKSMSYIPFDLLLQKAPESGSKSNYKDLSYLIKDYTISYGYSSSILFKNTKTKSETNNNKLLAFAPSYQRLTSDTTELAKLGKFRDGFSELYFNKDEVASISKYFNSTVLTSESATEKAFHEEMENHDIIHLALHTLLDNENPTNSKLVFSPTKDSLFDNYLHNFELYNMNINTKLAVLSACNTGSGTIKSGEGVISLARAFTYAGAESVVMSLWQVNDFSTSKLMEDFYHQLSLGKSKSEALRNAKIKYLDNASFTENHPYYWGAFVVIGDDSKLQSSIGWSNSKWWIIIASSLMLIIISLVIYKKKNLKI